ncbi:MAG: hypothetical protein O2779_00745 [Nanoarchaeota archaeon]|nr:hypothetical protein [Nanoarchaeota archaeon]
MLFPILQEIIVEIGIIVVIKNLITHLETMDLPLLLGFSAILLVLGALFFVERHFAAKNGHS